MHNSGRASRGTADGGAVMRAELQEGTVTLPTASARLAEAQGHGHTRPPRPVTQEGQGRAWESQCPGREPGWLCPLTVRAPSCRLATEDVFCQRCRDGIGWGTCFFSVSSTSLEIISVAWLQSQPWPLGVPTRPVLDPRELWAS